MNEIGKSPEGEAAILARLADVQEQLESAARWELEFAAWELEHIAESLREYIDRADEALHASTVRRSSPACAAAIDGFLEGQRRALQAIRSLATNPRTAWNASLALRRARASVATVCRIQHLKEEHVRRFREQAEAERTAPPSPDTGEPERVSR